MATTSDVMESLRGREQEHERFERVYVWEFPIRLCHWVNALSITVLFATGLYMAHPVLISSGEAWNNFAMGRVREVHFAAAYIFAVSYAIRIAWFFLGNRFARTGMPYVWRASWWRAFLHQAWSYLRLDSGRPQLGHNAIGGLSYFVFIFGLGAMQILTGFALYSQSNPGGALDRWFGWVIPMFGDPFSTLMWHHLFAWGFVFFVILHVYIVLLDSREYRNGLIGSIIHGTKFRPVGASDDDEEGLTIAPPCSCSGSATRCSETTASASSCCAGCANSMARTTAWSSSTAAPRESRCSATSPGGTGLLVLDALALGDTPGTVSLLRDPQQQLTSAGFGAHGANASGLLASAQLLGDLPEQVALVGVTPAELHTGVGLSDAAERALPEALELAAKTLAELRGDTSFTS